MQKAFIETQFPAARLLAELYKERKAVSGETLTGLGKWWGTEANHLGRTRLHLGDADARIERFEERPRDLPEDPHHHG